MEKTNKKWYWVGISTVILTVISDRISDQTKDIPILKWIIIFFQWLYNIGKSILQYEIKLGVILLTLGVLYLLYKIIKSFKTESTPDFLEYKSDIVIEWIWKWGYQNNGRGGYEMTYMTAFCPECDVALRIDGTISKARCPNCKREYKDGPYVTYVDGGRQPGKWEDYTDTLHIIQSRIEKYKKKSATIR